MATSTKKKAAASEPAVEPFSGFSSATFRFLMDLADTQSRDWFQEHKVDFERYVRDPMASFVAALGEELRRRKLPFKSDPKRAVFRIHRDVRFSKDKSPYKTHVSAALTRDGEKLSPGVLYVHVDPKGSFAAAGFYQPETDALKAIRQRIAAKPAEFRGVIEKLSGNGLALSEDEGALKRPPRGFEGITEPDVLGWLRRSLFTVHTPLTQKAVKDAALPKRVADFAEASRPLLEFGWKAIDGAGVNSRSKSATKKALHTAAE